MAFVAVLILICGLIYVATLVPLGKLTPLGGAGVFACVLVAAIVVAVVIPNTSGITHLVVKATQYFSMSVDMQQAATVVRSSVIQVQTDKGEVTQIKNQIQALAQQASDANTRVAQSEQHVTEMRNNVRQAYVSLFETLAYSLDTRNTFPIPDSVAQQIDGNLNILLVFAFPDLMERMQEVNKVQSLVRSATNRPIPMPTH
jgi:hypothetical protein